jgi:hypothetical protein
MKKLFYILFCCALLVSVAYAQQIEQNQIKESVMPLQKGPDDVILISGIKMKLKDWKAKPDGGGEWKSEKAMLEPSCDLCGVEVISAGGHITLKGNVATPEARRAAERIAKGVPGVKGVTNSILIRK